MEALYLTNKNGENVGVYMDLSQYEEVLEARRELEDARRQIELIEDALLEIVDSTKEHGIYEYYVEHVEEIFREGGESPERAAHLSDMLEDLEARRALKADMEEGEDDFVPWSEAKERIAAERASRR